MKKLILTPLIALLALPATAADWPLWGGEPTRNMVNSAEKNMPVEFDIDSGKNIKWVVELGSQSYGNPIIYKGKIFVGTNNEKERNPAIKGDKGVIMCFRESDGEFLWQAVHDKLAAGRVNDWPLQGICSSPAVDGDRLYYVNNRCELVCVDTEGFMDGENDGPIKDESDTGKQAADYIWSYDMIEELGAFPHNLATSSPLVIGDLVYLLTGNGVDEGHLNLPSPTSPSFIAIHKKTGELVWERNDPGDKVLHGQWSSPAYAEVAGRKQVIFPGGDGIVYSIDAMTGESIWQFDCNPKASKWELGGYGTRNNLIATPVVYDDRVFIGVGQDPEHGTGIGHLYSIRMDGKGDVTDSAAVWHIGNKDFGRTMSTAAIADGRMYIADLAGYFYCLDEKTGKVLWRDDLMSSVWSSAMIVDGKVYIGDEDGDLTIYEHSATMKKLSGNLNLRGSIYTTPSPANGVLYVATKSKLFAIENK